MFNRYRKKITALETRILLLEARSRTMEKLIRNLYEAQPIIEFTPSEELSDEIRKKMN